MEHYRRTKTGKYVEKRPYVPTGWIVRKCKHPSGKVVRELSREHANAPFYWHCVQFGDNTQLVRRTRRLSGK